MEDSQSELKITRSAIADLHGMLASYRDKPIESVAAELQTMLERAYQEARGTPDRVTVVYDTVAGDYHRQIYQLRFMDGDRPCVLLGVVADDYDRRTGQSFKVLITLITFKLAKRSILSGRWRNPDGTPIRLPAPVDATPPTPVDTPAPPPASAPMPSEVPVGSDGRPKRGFRRGGTTTERDAFVLDILRRAPETSVTGQNGIHAQVRDRFGVGMREGHIARLRAQLAVERAQGQLAPIATDAGAAQELVATVGELLRALGRLKALTAQISSTSANAV